MDGTVAVCIFKRLNIYKSTHADVYMFKYLMRRYNRGLVIITVASFKGGVGKTTTAVHLAAYLQETAPALLVDGDANRSATVWGKRGGLPFKVVDERQAARYARNYEHIIIDTAARPDEDDLKALADGCDLLVIPVTRWRWTHSCSLLRSCRTSEPTVTEFYSQSFRRGRAATERKPGAP